MPSPCAQCASRAVIVRPKTGARLCKACFIAAFEAEIHATITASSLFRPGERVAVGASGGKDSTVLAAVLQTLNARHGYGLDLTLLAVDEGIKGYRDDALRTVERHAAEFGLPLRIVGYDELYGWTMDQVVSQVGRRGNCTYCGVFRRQALDRGAAMLGVAHVVTGHNADDIAETVLMNLLRGDLPRLSRATSILTTSPSAAPTFTTAASASSPAVPTRVKRSKPLKYAYEKEIVLYAHHRGLRYFSTECVYSPEAFRGGARALVKDLERARPSAILDLVRSGEEMARLCPGYVEREAACRGDCAGAVADEEDEAAGAGGCGRGTGELPAVVESAKAEKPEAEARPRLERPARAPKQAPKQTIGVCERCGYMSSQAVCKACLLLESLNRNRPKTDIEVTLLPKDRDVAVT